MNHQLVRNAGLILVFSILAACTGTATKTGEETRTDSVAATPKSFDLLGIINQAAGSGGAGPVLPMIVQYGIKGGVAQECAAGVGICSVTGGLSGPNGYDSLQVVGGALMIRTNKTALQEGDGPLSDSLNKYGMNGVISYQADCEFSKALSKQLGAAGLISIKEGMPMVFANESNDPAPGKVAIITYGAIPGNSACIRFSNCAGTAYNLSVSLAAADSGCIGQAYTGFYDMGNGFGSLSIYMRTENVTSQPGISDCMPQPDPGSLATSWLSFKLAGDVQIDSATAASITVPAGSVIYARQNNAQALAFYPTGWCMLSLTVTLPAGGGDATKKK